MFDRSPDRVKFAPNSFPCSSALSYREFLSSLLLFVADFSSRSVSVWRAFLCPLRFLGGLPPHVRPCFPSPHTRTPRAYNMYVYACTRGVQGPSIDSGHAIGVNCTSGSRSPTPLLADAVRSNTRGFVLVSMCAHACRRLFYRTINRARDIEVSAVHRVTTPNGPTAVSSTMRNLLTFHGRATTVFLFHAALLAIVSRWMCTTLARLTG